MSVNDHGWVFRGERGDETRVYDSIFLGNYREASIMTLFYDSSLDMHRPQPCPGVDSLWCGGVIGHTATLFWSSRFPHPDYELSYIPEGGSWDAATTIQISDTTATVDLPDGRCHLFRVRGLCDGHRRPHSPWSDTIAVCPGVGIDAADSASAISLFPNPTEGTVEIVGLAGEAATVEVVDMAGRVVQTHEKTASFSVAALPAGTYIVRVVTRTVDSVDRHHYLKLVKK
ncbi:MAG: T9SS type A sorting domain-containing protein [Bacteroidales bacterium]|nr:T9SS type A sorting domain-containing protein [Bacteroidales bacterium]